MMLKYSWLLKNGQQFVATFCKKLNQLGLMWARKAFIDEHTNSKEQTSDAEIEEAFHARGH
jgi:hypothetical protein